jgi:uncharacterized FAD-dependent dehydrogenase
MFLRLNDLLKAKLVNHVQPSPYTRGNALKFAESVKQARNAIKNSNILTWMSAGGVYSNDEYPGRDFRYCLLENFINGARGYLILPWYGLDAEDLKEHAIAMQMVVPVEDIIVEDNVVKGVILDDGSRYYGKYVVLGVGRNGSEWLTEILSKHNVKFKNNRVDLGVRVETNDIIMDEINKNLYEGKFIFNTSVGTQVRTFCSNPSGHVVVENHNGVMLCNGHSYNDTKLGSSNTNFALLVSQEFDEPFNDPNEYAYEISKLANKLSDGSVIVQKYGDIKKGRRSTYKRIAEGFVKPTLKEAIPGDLGLVLPYNFMKSLIEMIEALNYVSPGIASDHTLFYGVEAKFYSDRPVVDNNFESSIKNLYLGGDGAGITRGLAQAGANGVKIARVIINKNN